GVAYSPACRRRVCPNFVAWRKEAQARLDSGSVEATGIGNEDKPEKREERACTQTHHFFHNMWKVWAKRRLAVTAQANMIQAHQFSGNSRIVRMFANPPGMDQRQRPFQFSSKDPQ